MNSVKGTPAYWGKILHQVLAPGFKPIRNTNIFLTLSCTDLRQNELISNIFKLNRVDISDKEVDEMSHHKTYDTLNKNPVLVARHFQYRVEIFSKIIVLDGLLEKTQYYAIRVEFQVRGNPYIHSFIWILSVPKLAKVNINIDDYKKWVDSVIRSHLPYPNMSKHCLNLQKLTYTFSFKILS